MTGNHRNHAVQRPTTAEQKMLYAALVNRERCMCGDIHDDGMTPVMKARMKGYLAAHPGQQFVYDEEIVAVIIPGGPGDPEVIAWDYDLADLLDAVDAPSAAELS